MKTQITRLEKQVLDGIQEFTTNLFTSDNGNWSYIHEIFDNKYNDYSIESRIGRGVISSLIQKGILIYEANEDGCDGGYVEVTENYYRETGNLTPCHSPEIEYINIEVK